MTYFQHGRRHRKRGTDPILDWAETPWAHLEISSSTVPGTNAQTYMSIKEGGPGFFATNDVNRELFDSVSHTISGTPYWGLQIKQGGTYSFEIDGAFPSMVAAGLGEMGWAGFDMPGGHVGPATAVWQFGRRAVVATDTWDPGEDNHVFWAEKVAIQGPRDSIDPSPVSGNSNVPFTVLLFAKQNGGADVNVRMALWVERLGDDAYYPGSWV